MIETVLQLNGVSVRIDTDAGLVEAVDEVSLTVNRGELVGIVGESGSGKSTLLKAIAGSCRGALTSRREQSPSAMPTGPTTRPVSAWCSRSRSVRSIR